MRGNKIRWTGAVAGLLLAIALDAQSGGSMVVNVPFEFQAASTVYPAGDYHLRIGSTDQPVVTIENRNGEDRGVLQTRLARRTGETRAKLVFWRYGEKHFLRQIWGRGARTGREVAVSEQERGAAETARRDGIKPVRVALVGAKP